MKGERLGEFEELTLLAVRALGDSTYAVPVQQFVEDATGRSVSLGAVYAALDIAAAETVGVGDAENDQAFLRMCGLAVAVDNALPAVKDMAHVVTAGARGAGVSELIARLLGGELEEFGA